MPAGDRRSFNVHTHTRMRARDSSRPASEPQACKPNKRATTAATIALPRARRRRLSARERTAAASTRDVM